MLLFPCPSVSQPPFKGVAFERLAAGRYVESCDVTVPSGDALSAPSSDGVALAADRGAISMTRCSVGGPPVVCLVVQADNLMYCGCCVSL